MEMKVQIDLNNERFDSMGLKQSSKNDQVKPHCETKILQLSD